MAPPTPEQLADAVTEILRRFEVPLDEEAIRTWACKKFPRQLDMPMVRDALKRSSAAGRIRRVGKANWEFVSPVAAPSPTPSAVTPKRDAEKARDPESSAPRKPTPEQRAVIESGIGDRLLVEAGPGTGKTETVARRIQHLLGFPGTRPSDILVLSFSRAAVKVLVDRLRAMQQEELVEEVRHLAIRTFDSWAFRVLRHLGLEAKDLLKGGDHEVTIKLLTSTLRKQGRGVFVRPGSALPIPKHIVVDEVQDLTGPRAALLQALLEAVAAPGTSGCGFTLLGDPEQAIYGFTNKQQEANSLTSAGFLKWVKHDYRKELKQLALTRNHRSQGVTAELMATARSLVKGLGPGGAEKILKLLGTGEPLPKIVKEVGRAAADGASLVFLCKDNGAVLQLAGALEKEFEEQGKALPPTRILGGTPPAILPSWIGRLLSRFEAATLTRSNFDRIFKTLESPPWGGNAQLAWALLERFALVGEKSTAIDMARLRERIAWPDSLPDDEGERACPLTFSTIHQAKGREFDRVRIIPSEVRVDEDPAEAARVMYVAVTRARSQVAAASVESEPLFAKELRQGPRRWHRWQATRKGAYHHLELGCDGDVDSVSIIDSEVMETPQEVQRVQQALVSHERELIGLKVELRRTVISEDPFRVAYRIHADVPGVGALCLGQMSDLVRMNISELKAKKQSLPKTIYGLRVGAVTTCVTTLDLPGTVPTPWRLSKIWLGVAVHGIGTFHSYWKGRSNE